jgi:hypothetical protein
MHWKRCSLMLWPPPSKLSVSSPGCSCIPGFAFQRPYFFFFLPKLEFRNSSNCNSYLWLSLYRFIINLTFWSYFSRCPGALSSSGKSVAVFLMLWWNWHFYISVSYFVDPLPSDPRSCSQKLQTRRILHDLLNTVHLMCPHPPLIPPRPHPPRVSDHTVSPSAPSSITNVHRCIGSREVTRQTLATSVKLTSLSMYDTRFLYS